MVPVRKLLQGKGSQIWSVSPEDSVYDAVRLMAEKNIGAVLVMKAGRLVGILSERDCARRALLQDRPARQTSVVEIMTSPVIYCRPEFTLESCMAIMTENRVRHLPVLVDGKPVGMITLGDVVKEIISSQQNDIQRLENLVTGMELEQLE